MIEVLKQALEALEKNYKLINGEGTSFGLEGAMDGYYSGCFDVDGTNKETENSITSLRQAIAEFDSHTLYREGYVNGYAFGEAAGRKAVAEKQDGVCQHCAGKGCVACDAREQEPATCKECHLKDTVYDLLGDLKVANLKLSVRSQRTWVGLMDEDQFNLVHAMNENDWDAVQMMDAIEAKLKEKNT